MRYLSEDGVEKTLFFESVIGEGGYGRVYKASLDGFGYVAAKISVFTKEGKKKEITEMLYLECDISVNDMKHAVLLKRYIYNGKDEAIFGNDAVRKFTGNEKINFGVKSGDCPATMLVTIYDLVDGINLKTDIQNHKTLGRPYDIHTITHYTRSMIKGLVEISNNGIAHRDIKPANFMVQRGKVKFIDFGISCRYSKCPKVMKGSFSYAAPELWQGVFDNFQKADVYSLGRTLCSFFLDDRDREFIQIKSNEELLAYLKARIKEESFVELIAGMMNFDVNARLTPTQALEMANKMKNPSFFRRLFGRR